jgi:HNH endonuclease
MVRGQLSCERCGSAEIRRYPKQHADDYDHWMCRPCIIAHEIVEHALYRMNIAQYHATLSYVPHPSENIKTNIAAARSRARRRHLPATLDMGDWRRIIAFFNNACAYCGDKWEQIEHATPLCRGGGSTIANCLPTCVICNRNKHQDTLEELLTNDLWPHCTARLERALDWLQQYGRTSTNPSGSSGDR